jgi:hypothetical protein
VSTKSTARNTPYLHRKLLACVLRPAETYAAKLARSECFAQFKILAEYIAVLHLRLACLASQIVDEVHRGVIRDRELPTVSIGT